GTGAEVVLVNKSIILSGGWNAGFTAQGGTSTIDGGAARRGITVNAGITVAANHFTILNGSTNSQGGGIYNSGTLTLSNSIVSGNASPLGGGGGIYTTGTLTVLNSAIYSNQVAGGGGGIYN